MCIVLIYLPLRFLLLNVFGMVLLYADGVAVDVVTFLVLTSVSAVSL